MVVKGHKIRYELVPQSHYCVCMCIWANHGPLRASRVTLVVKNPSANAGDIRHSALIPGVGRPHGGGHGNPPRYSCLQNPTDRGAWRATVHRVAKSQTRLEQLSTHAVQEDLFVYIFVFNSLYLLIPNF